MKQRYSVFLRPWGVYYCQDNTSGQQESPLRHLSLLHGFFHTLNQRSPMRDSNRQNHLVLTRLRDNRILKSGPSFFMFTLAGNNSSVVVPKIFAKMKSSPSGTRRCCVSSLASDSRLTSQPKTCNLADKFPCVQPLRLRNSRTCFPIRFSGDETFLMPSTLATQDGADVRFRSQIRLSSPARFWDSHFKNFRVSIIFGKIGKLNRIS